MKKVSFAAAHMLLMPNKHLQCVEGIMETQKANISVTFPGTYDHSLCKHNPYLWSTDEDCAYKNITLVAQQLQMILT